MRPHPGTVPILMPDSPFVRSKEAMMAAIMALPNPHELANMPAAEIEQLRQYGNAIDNLLYGELRRRLLQGPPDKTPVPE